MSEVSESAQHLMELERAVYRRYLEGDIDAMMDEFLLERAMVCPPGMDRIVGRDNQRALFKQLAALEGFELWWEPVDAEVSPSEEMGWVYGHVRWKMPGEAEVSGKYLSIWVQEDGAWRNAVEIRNASA